jgi:hypothetical protein
MTIRLEPLGVTLGLATMMRATATGVVAVVVGGCSLPDRSGDAQTPTAPLSEPRSQVVKQLTMPPGSVLADRIGTYFENWLVHHTADLVDSYLAPQLPVFKDFDGRPWCNTVTTMFNRTKETKWVWGTADDGLMVFVTGIADSSDPGSHYSRVIVLTGAAAGKNATGCAQ